MRLVLDTNVLVSAVLTDGKPRKVLRLCIDGKHTLLASPTTVDEFAEVLARPKFKLSADEVHRAVAAVVQTAELIQTTSRLSAVAADPDDNRFLELSVDGRADLIVSGDPHLLNMGEFRGVPIVKAADALKLAGT